MRQRHKNKSVFTNHSRKRSISIPGITDLGKTGFPRSCGLAFDWGGIISITSQIATHVCPSPASALSQSKDLKVEEVETPLDSLGEIVVSSYFRLKYLLNRSLQEEMLTYSTFDHEHHISNHQPPLHCGDTNHIWWGNSCLGVIFVITQNIKNINQNPSI